MPLQFYDWASIIFDISIPFAVLGDLAIFVTFGKRINTLCPIFLSSMRNIVLINFFLYAEQLIIKEPANFGLFRQFYIENGWWMGKIVLMNTAVWPVIGVVFQFVIAVSRFWAIWAPISYLKFWKTSITSYLMVFIWAIGFALALHVCLFVQTGAYSQDGVAIGNSLAFKPIVPNFMYTIILVYVNGFLIGAITFCYLSMTVALWRLKKSTKFNRKYSWTSTTKRIVITQIVILLPKYIYVSFTIYWYLMNFFPTLNLPPVNMSLYFLTNKFQATGYGILATIAILICFPMTFQAMKGLFWCSRLPNERSVASWESARNERPRSAASLRGAQMLVSHVT